jgi:hypothetical protein
MLDPTRTGFGTTKMSLVRFHAILAGDQARTPGTPCQTKHGYGGGRNVSVISWIRVVWRSIVFSYVTPTTDTTCYHQML